MIFFKWVILFFSLTLSAYSQSPGESEDSNPSNERINKIQLDSKVVKRDRINVIIYDLIDQFVDYFQSDINHKKSITFDKKYQFSDEDKLWKEEKSGGDQGESPNVELGVGMLSRQTLNVAIISLDVDKSISSDAQVYLYREMMSRDYKTKDDQSIHFIDVFSERRTGIQYDLSKVSLKNNSQIDEKYIDELRQKVYFDCYAQLRLVKTGVTVTFQVVFFDAKSKGVILVMDYNKLVAQVGSLPIDFNFYYSLAFGNSGPIYIPMYYSVNLGKKLYGIGSFGFDVTFETYNFNQKTIGDKAALEIDNVESDSTASTSKKQRAINKYAASSVLFGPYFVLNINELARRKTSIFEFFLGANFRLGYYIAATPIYQPLFFDVNLFYRMTVGHWFFIGLGMNTIVMYPNESNRGATKLPMGPANFVLSLGVNVF